MQSGTAGKSSSVSRDLTSLERIEQQVGLIKLLLTGDGNPSRGLIVRVALIERMFKILLGAVLAGTVALILLLVKVMIE